MLVKAFISRFVDQVDFHSVLTTLIVTTIIVIYSLLLGNIFGHGTFWKLKHRKDSILSTYRRIVSDAKSFAISPSKPLLSDTHSVNKLIRLPDQVLLEILGFLDGCSLMKVALCSNGFRCLAYSRSLWLALFHNTFEKHLLVDFIQYLQDIQYRPLDTDIYTIRNYFICLKKYPWFLLTQSPNTVNVIVRGDVLYLPYRFVDDEHPGGGNIIHHYHMHDATRIFDISNHSEAALMQMKRYVRWSSRRFCAS